MFRNYIFVCIVTWQLFAFVSTLWENWKSRGVAIPFQLPENINVFNFPDLLNMINMTVAAKENKCYCPRIYIPVCGSDEKSYVNGCIANCMGITVLHNGACLKFRRTNNNATSKIIIPSSWTKISYDNKIVNVSNASIWEGSFIKENITTF